MADESKYEPVQLDREHVQRARNAAAWFMSRGMTWMTLHSILVGGETKLELLEQAFCGGNPFPDHLGPIPAGRPPKRNGVEIQAITESVMAKIGSG